MPTDRKMLDVYKNEVKNIIACEQDRRYINNSLKDIEKKLKIKKSKNKIDNSIDRKIVGIKHLRKGINLLW